MPRTSRSTASPLTVFNDNTAILNALRSGQVDFATVTQKDASSLESAGLTIESFPAYTVSGLYLFDREGTLVPALGDVRVRQALNLALDKEGILEGVYGGVGTRDIAVVQRFQRRLRPGPR